jgi:hypothetical protein
MKPAIPTNKIFAIITTMVLSTVYANAQIGIGTTSPGSTLDVRGSLSLSYRAFTGATTAAITDNTLVFTGTSAATITLPTVASIAGRVYWIKNTSSNASLLTIATTSSQTIDGTGNVGIGTASPGNKLEVNSGTSGVSGLRLKQMPAGGLLFISSTTDVTGNNSNLYFDNTNYRLSIGAGTTPASTLQSGGSFAAGIVTKTANYTASVSDHTILCNNTAGAITIGLPSAAGITGRIYVIKKISAAGNDVVLGTYFGAETIDSSTSFAITTQDSSIMLQSNGTAWFIYQKINLPVKEGIKNNRV